MFTRSTCTAALAAAFALAGAQTALAQTSQTPAVQTPAVQKPAVRKPAATPAATRQPVTTPRQPAAGQAVQIRNPGAVVPPPAGKAAPVSAGQAPAVRGVDGVQLPPSTQGVNGADGAQPPASQQPGAAPQPVATPGQPGQQPPAHGPADAPHHAEHEHAHAGPTMRTATRTPVPVSDLTSDVVILPTYHAHQDLNQLTPFQPLGSMQAFSQGTPGSYSGLSIRGNAMQDTLVLLDGFRVSPSGGTDFSLLPIAYGSRTEILRGPGSAVYGQNAAGGVVQLLSAAPEAGTRASGEAGIGGRGYMQMRGRLSGGNDQITGRIDLGRERGDGFDATARDYPGNQNDQDNWKRDNISGRLDARLSTATHVTFVAVRNTVNADFDGVYNGASALAAKKRLEVLGVKASHEISPTGQLQAKVGQSSVSNTWNFTNTALWDKTRLREYGLSLSERLMPNVQGLVGVERLEEGYDTRGLKSPTRSTNALYGNAVGTWGRHQVNVALRMDDSNRYNSTFSHQIGYGYRLAPNLRVVGNLNTGYRMPDMADYYASAQGNRLKQQRNQTVDGGIYWQPTSTVYAKAVAYRTRVRDRLTVAGNCSGVADCSVFNLGHATINGIALSVGQDTAPGQAFEGLRWQANLDLVDPKNKDTGRILPHVSKRTLNGQVDYGLGDYSVGADVVVNNRRFSDEANQLRVGGGLLVNLRSAWHVSQELTAYADVYNIGNRMNATWRYYNQQPRTVMLGVAYSPR